jgi:hypothetical protein
LKAQNSSVGAQAFIGVNLRRLTPESEKEKKWKKIRREREKEENEENERGEKMKKKRSKQRPRKEGNPDLRRQSQTPALEIPLSWCAFPR